MNWLWTMVFVLACGDASDPQELLSGHMRGLGAQNVPLVTEPGSQAGVEVTFYVGLPPGETMTQIEPFADDPSPFALTLPPGEISIVPQSQQYQDYGKIRLGTFKAKLSVPGVSFFSLTGGKGQVRYGVRVVSSGGWEEKILGSYLVYPPGAPELLWKAPVAQINSLPGTGSKDSSLDIKGIFTDHNNEETKIGWFVTGGSLKNRRALRTVWETPNRSGGEQVILTVRGKKSKSFSLDIKNVQLLE
jgi:hypothetical protein